MNQEHLDNLNKGKQFWNEWRTQCPEVLPNLRGAHLTIMDSHQKYPLERRDFTEFNLSKTDLGRTNLRAVDFSGVDLSSTYLDGAILTEADLTGANLQWSNLEEANLKEAKLSQANFYFANLQRADLTKTDCRNTIFYQADLGAADLTRANFSNANLREANLMGTRLVKTIFENTDLAGSSIWGISAWDLNLEGANQTDLVITPKDYSIITVDNLEVAQFIYLLLNNQKLRDVVDTITSKTVLILGRFTPERKIVLDTLRDALREHNFVPIIFDFERPKDRDFTETIVTLTGMCRFVIADITNPKSSPLELQATVPDYMIPFVPILQKGESPFSMFRDLKAKYDWVLDTLAYDSVENLIKCLDKAIIFPALQKGEELMKRKANELKIRDIQDYL
ncbi:MAG: pentapeptide repeat-containing protein [Leptolyngbya sp.]|nr:MAG: pentapeptide repeat-containing protein [Leptolyngbya sp.]